MRIQKENVMGKPAKGIPEGFHSVTPELMVKNASEAIEFYKKAFGAQELSRMETPDRKAIMHAEPRIGASIIFVGDEFPAAGIQSPHSAGTTTASFHLFVDDADTAFKKAVLAGARVKMPMADMFWGDRYGRLIDPYGHEWGIATRIEELTPEEMKKRAEIVFAKSENK